MAKLTKEQVNQLCRDNITNYVFDKLKGLDDGQYQVCIEDNLIDLFITVPVERQSRAFDNYMKRINKDDMPNTINKPINAKAYLTEIGWLQPSGYIDNQNDLKESGQSDEPDIAWQPGDKKVMIGKYDIDIEKIVALGHYFSHYVKD